MRAFSFPWLHRFQLPVRHGGPTLSSRRQRAGSKQQNTTDNSGNFFILPVRLESRVQPPTPPGTNLLLLPTERSSCTAVASHPGVQTDQPNHDIAKGALQTCQLGSGVHYLFPLWCFLKLKKYTVVSPQMYTKRWFNKQTFCYKMLCLS